MEQAMDNVVNKFDEAERNLEEIETRLEDGFAKHLKANEAGDNVEDKASLLAHLDEVKQDYAEIKKEAAELGQLQREMALAFQKQLLSTVQKLQGLTETQSLNKGSAEVTSAAIESLVEQSNVAESLTNKLKKL
uniref:Protein FAM33A n=1 Tax=Ciona savignyi TaxID=51511 RepID=H2ZFH1_CIOSA